MKHLLVLEVRAGTKKRLTEAVENGDNIYNISSLDARDADLSEAVKGFMADVHQVPVKVEDEVFVICGKNTIREEHVLVSVLHKRFAECIKLFVVREDNKEVEIPHELRYFIDEEKTSDFGNSNFKASSGGGCGGNCGGGCHC